MLYEIILTQMLHISLDDGRLLMCNAISNIIKIWPPIFFYFNAYQEFSPSHYKNYLWAPKTSASPHKTWPGIRQ